MIKKLFIILSIFILSANVSLAFTYGSNFINSGNITADGWASLNNVVDGNLTTNGYNLNTTDFHYINASTTKTIAKIGFYPYANPQGQFMKDFTITGTNNNWVSSSTLYSAQVPNCTTEGGCQWYYYEFSNSNSYNQTRVNFLSTWNTDYLPRAVALQEIEMYECLDCGGAVSPLMKIFLWFL
jgi:hypothetical protein